MELQFSKTSCQCLKKVLSEVRSLEQAQEIRLSDGMPDIGRVLCGWGQVLQRSKEWNGDSVSLSAGMMVWVLYTPEDGSEARWVEGWIPFSVQWDLPESVPEGTLQIQCITRFVDARSVSARKLMVRAGIGALAEAYIPYETQAAVPEEAPENVELKKVKYPLRLPREAGEKTFSLDEELTLPGTVPAMKKLVCYTLDPEVQEQRVMADKIVFRGSVRLHVLYEDPEGAFHSWDFEIPFSQYGEARESRSTEAEAAVVCAVTALEAEQIDETRLHLKCSMTAQYVVDDQELLELVEDAYSPVRELGVETDTLELDEILESRRETVPVEMNLPGIGDQVADVTFLPDFPRQRTVENGISHELAGTFQVLSYSTTGDLQAAVSRWDGQITVPADGEALIHAQPLSPSLPQILLGSGEKKVRTELPLQMTVTAGAGIPMVTGLQLGETREPDEKRPSLILRRAENRDLWEIAKSAGSTIHAIRSANNLQEDPVPGQMLLIPIL